MPHDTPAFPVTLRIVNLGSKRMRLKVPGAAIGVAAGVPPAVEPGVSPGGKRVEVAGALKISWTAGKPVRRFRTAGCRPLRQARRLTLPLRTAASNRTCTNRCATLAFMILLILARLVPATNAQPSAWRAQHAPLMTRWAAEVNPTNVHPEYPRPQLARSEWLNLNGLWDYAMTPSTAEVPTRYEGQILVPFPVESALSGVMRRLEETNTLWYRRQVAIPAAWRGRRVRLHFGAVDWRTRVLVNGQAVGQHQGGYDRFSFDITERLRWDGKDEIVVAVTDPTEGGQPRGKQSRKPEGIFYTANSGIWQTVWLEPVPATSLDDLRTTPDLDARQLRVRTSVNSLSDKLRVEAIALAEGREVGRVSGAPNTELVLALKEIKPWSPDAPFLYDLQVTLTEDGRELDRVTGYFGMRKISLGKDEDGVSRIALNNRFLFQIGTLDQGFWPDGIYTAPTDAALRSDIEALKKLGFNLTRKHVKVEPDRWYYWCDKLGLLVWQDMPSGDNATPEGRRQFEVELLQMVRQLHNHPSIIAWVLFNEGWGQYETERLTQLLKTVDASRLINNASGWTDMRVGDLIDVHSYPGPDSPDPESRRASVLGEFGGLGLSVPGHVWSSNFWGYHMMADRNELNERYARLLKQVWSMHDLRGLSAAVYTQTTDVETECNGLLTYDRAVTKLDPAVVLAANRGDERGPRMKIILPDGQLGRSPWRYTTGRPGEDWFKPGFDVSSWKEGTSGFGTGMTPGARVNTTWETPDIWLRREFNLGAEELSGVKLRLYHDEDAEIYLNGVLAAKVTGFITDYREFDLSPEAARTLRPGNNTIAAHCHQTAGGQCIDIGVLVPKPKATANARGN
jgi:hypothetical protein